MGHKGLPHWVIHLAALSRVFPIICSSVFLGILLARTTRLYEHYNSGDENSKIVFEKIIILTLKDFWTNINQGGFKNCGKTLIGTAATTKTMNTINIATYDKDVWSNDAEIKWD